MAFSPRGKTYQLASNTTSQIVTIQSDAPCSQYRLASHQPTTGTGLPVYVYITTNSSAVITSPKTAVPSYATVIPPCTVSVVTGPPVQPGQNVYVAFITESGTAEAYITPGEGS